MPNTIESASRSLTFRSIAKADVTASIMVRASGFWALTSLANASESLNTPVEDSLLTQWTASMSLVTFPAMCSGFIALPQGTSTFVTSFPLSCPSSMDLFPKEPLVSPRDLLLTPFLIAASSMTVADPPTRKTSISVLRAFWIFSTMPAWSSLYSLQRCVIIGLVIA